MEKSRSANSIGRLYFNSTSLWLNLLTASCWSSIVKVLFRCFRFITRSPIARMHLNFRYWRNRNWMSRSTLTTPTCILCQIQVTPSFGMNPGRACLPSGLGHLFIRRRSKGSLHPHLLQGRGKCELLLAFEKCLFAGRPNFLCDVHMNVSIVYMPERGHDWAFDHIQSAWWWVGIWCSSHAYVKELGRHV
jgi:hypothetical protein